MGIWIRSQDERELVEIVGVSLFTQENIYDHSKNKYIIKGRDLGGSISGLGIYSTEKKAVRVMNRIVDRITLQEYIHDYGRQLMTEFVLRKYKDEEDPAREEYCNHIYPVFQMPQDEEV